MAPSIAAVLLAGGTGARFGGRTAKQFLRLRGEPLFVRSLRVFLSVPAVREIVIVAQPAYFGRILRAVPARAAKRVRLAAGGRFRGESVRNGVRALGGDTDVVLVHDTARPLVTAEIIRRVADAANATGASLAAWPLPDTLKRVDRRSRVRATVARQGLWVAQTPQGFRWDVARDALLRPSRTATDDVELAERRGHAVQVVDGAATNLKVTYPSDLKVLEALL